MRRINLFLATLSLGITGVAHAQSATIAPAQAENVLRAGTPIALRMAETLTTKEKKLKAGHRFNMEVAESVVLNGVTVIPSGTPAIGEVTDVRNKGMWGKSGHINARALYLRINGRQIRLTGQMNDKGTTGTAGVVGAVVFLPVAGFFVTGTSAEITTGSAVKAFLDEDLTVAFSTAPVAPEIVVPVGK